MKKGYFGILIMLVMLVGIMVPVLGALAQSDAAATAEAAVKADEISLLLLIKKGGWAMYPLGLFSFATLFFVIRNIMLLKEKTLLHADLKPQIEELLKEKKITEARTLCEENTCLMTFVLDAGLERVSEKDFDHAHVMEAIEEAGNEQMVTFMRPINYLSIIGSTAPMLGLLGTVSGMIKAFTNLALGKGADPAALANNISEALVTTAAGLIIAIPAMMAYFIFKNNFIKSMSSMGRMVSHFINVYRNAQ